MRLPNDQVQVKLEKVPATAGMQFKFKWIADIWIIEFNCNNMALAIMK